MALLTVPGVGPPGVGKTLTAETVALFCGRPLLPVSVAEIGMEPDKAEENLHDIFADAGRWEAVLLMYVQRSSQIFPEKG